MDEAPPEPAPPASLSQQVAHGLRGADWRGGWLLPLTLAVWIALGPLLTIAGAKLLAVRERREASRIEAGLAPRFELERAAGEARTTLAAATARPALGATLEALATALPSDASLMRVERMPSGLIEFDVATSDPDALRTAMRRAPGLARFRNTSQRRTDAAMIVSLREEGQ